MKLRRATLSIAAAGAWLEARLAHAPDVRALVLALDAGSTLGTAALAVPMMRAAEDQGYATLAIKLLERGERERDPDVEFNIPLLARRVLAVLRWIEQQPDLARLPLAVLTSAAVPAALIRVAGSAGPTLQAAIALQGRPDLAGIAPLQSLRMPMLFATVEGSNEARVFAAVRERLRTPHQWLRLPAEPAADGGPGQFVDGVLRWLAQNLDGADEGPLPAG